MTIVLDTNVVLYYLADRLVEELPDEAICVSVITELELYSYPDLSADEEARIAGFLSRVNVIDLLPQIKNEAIALRGATRLKLPDALILATAKALKATLWTCDAGLAKRSDVPIFRPTLKSD